jgi:hypothetical protein
VINARKVEILPSRQLQTRLCIDSAAGKMWGEDYARAIRAPCRQSNFKARCVPLWQFFSRVTIGVTRIGIKRSLMYGAAA